jgi:hypothetical protein
VSISFCGAAHAGVLAAGTTAAALKAAAPVRNCRRDALGPDEWQAQVNDHLPDVSVALWSGCLHKGAAALPCSRMRFLRPFYFGQLQNAARPL